MNLCFGSFLQIWLQPAATVAAVLDPQVIKYNHGFSSGFLGFTESPP